MVYFVFEVQTRACKSRLHSHLQNPLLACPNRHGIPPEFVLTTGAASDMWCNRDSVRGGSVGGMAVGGKAHGGEATRERKNRGDYPGQQNAGTTRVDRKRGGVGETEIGCAQALSFDPKMDSESSVLFENLGFVKH